MHWNGDCYVTDLFGCRIARVTPSREVVTVVDEYEGGPLGGPNDLTFHPSGALYFTAPKGHYAQDPPPGRVYRLGPDGGVQLAADVAWPNGVNVNADGSVVYVADSHTGEALTYDVRADGTLANRGVLADLREGQDNWWAPDGMCLDVEGNLYVAVYGAYRVRRVTPEGEIDLDIPVGHEKPANCCFGGPDNDELFITCREGALYRVKIGIPACRCSGRRASGRWSGPSSPWNLCVTLRHSREGGNPPITEPGVGRMRPVIPKPGWILQRSPKAGI